MSPTLPQLLSVLWMSAGTAPTTHHVSSRRARRRQELCTSRTDNRHTDAQHKRPRRSTTTERIKREDKMQRRICRAGFSQPRRRMALHGRSLRGDARASSTHHKADYNPLSERLPSLGRLSKLYPMRIPMEHLTLQIQNFSPRARRVMLPGNGNRNHILQSRSLLRSHTMAVKA